MKTIKQYKTMVITFIAVLFNTIRLQLIGKQEEIFGWYSADGIQLDMFPLEQKKSIEKAMSEYARAYAIRILIITLVLILIFNVFAQYYYFKS